MGKYGETSAAIDALLYGLMIGTVTGTMLLAPNAVQILGKPMDKLFDKLDERQKQRALSRLRSYMKTRGLVRGDYDHGITLTKKALKRLEDYKFQNMTIEVPEKWDCKWRIVMFDIPETNRQSRVGFTNKIQSMGFQLLQQSVWLYPFECREVIFVASDYYGVKRWVTYIETEHIDNEIQLRRRFQQILKN